MVFLDFDAPIFLFHNYNVYSIKESMSVPTHNSEELMNELFKRNQHNQIIIAKYHRKTQKRYTLFISLQQLKLKDEENAAE